MALGFVESGFGGLVLVSVRRWGLGGFPLFGVTLAGSRPGGRPTSLRRQRSRQERRPRRAGRLLKLRLISRLPCAAHNRRPAQNSRAAPAQTAAPDIPACCCAARRLGRGFPESPRVSGRACVIDAKAKIPVSSLLTQEGRVSAAYPDTALADDIRRFSKGSVSAESPF